MNPYPHSLEAWWIGRLFPRVEKPSAAAAARRAEPFVARLSDAFTAKRDEASGAYASHEKSWLAYGLFFFPQTFMRVSFALDELRARGFPVPASPRVLDLGAGTGAATAALSCAWGTPGEATLLDRATAGLDLAIPMLQENCGFAPRTVKGDLLQPPEGKWDVILVSYALNEALADADPAAWISALAARLTPTGLLLVCEPLVHSAGPFMDRLRTAALHAGGLHLHAPCPHEAACPLAARRIACHDVRNWRMPPAAQALNNRLGRSIQILKFSFLALSPMPAAPPGAAFRLVAPVHATKGKWELSGCAPDGALRRYEVLRRDATPDQRRRIDALERGDRLELADLQPAGDAWRGRLSP